MYLFNFLPEDKTRYGHQTDYVTLPRKKSKLGKRSGINKNEQRERRKVLLLETLFSLLDVLCDDEVWFPLIWFYSITTGITTATKTSL